MTDTQDIAAEFVEISAPTLSPTLPTASSLQSGPAIEPLKRLFLYSADEWEGFIAEWASTCLKKKYKKVQRFTGANDRGIDIAGGAERSVRGNRVAKAQGGGRKGDIVLWAASGSLLRARPDLFEARLGAGLVSQAVLNASGRGGAAKSLCADHEYARD